MRLGAIQAPPPRPAVAEALDAFPAVVAALEAGTFSYDLAKLALHAKQCQKR